MLLAAHAVHLLGQLIPILRTTNPATLLGRGKTLRACTYNPAQGRMVGTHCILCVCLGTSRAFTAAKHGQLPFQRVVEDREQDEQETSPLPPEPCFGSPK